MFKLIDEYYSVTLSTIIAEKTQDKSARLQMLQNTLMADGTKRRMEGTLGEALDIVL